MPGSVFLTDPTALTPLGNAANPLVTSATISNLAALTVPYPVGATPVTVSATGTTGVVTATLPGVASKTTYLAGFTIGADATAFIVGTATVTGIVTGTASFRQAVGAVASQTLDTTKYFDPPIPASAVNTGIVINSIAAGTAGNTTVFAWGFQL